MSRIEEDIKAYYGVEWVNGNREGSVLEHYGTKRHSGRYPWGSGENPYQSSGDFLSRVNEVKANEKFSILSILNFLKSINLVQLNSELRNVGLNMIAGSFSMIEFEV